MNFKSVGTFVILESAPQGGITKLDKDILCFH